MTHQGQTAGGAEDGLQSDAEADTPHQGATGQGDRAAHARHTGECHLELGCGGNRILSSDQGENYLK